MKVLKTVLIFCLVFSFSLPIIADTYQIGPDRDTQSLKRIAYRLRPGDIVEIDHGVYREMMKLTANGTKDEPIIIRGVGEERSIFDADGLTVSGRGSIPRAIFQVEGANIILEHLEFRNARNGNNGAGIRLNGSTNVVIRDCKISYCDMGIQGGDKETALIEGCDIGFNSTVEHNGYSHNFYMTGNRVVVRNCYIHDSLYGQNYKSRAHYNELWYNWIVDSNEGEVGPVDGEGQTDRPNSNVVMVGNVVVSKPNRTGNNAKYILVGSELGGSHDGILYMYFNILVAGSPKIKFIQLDDPKTGSVVKNNIFYGSNTILVSDPESPVVEGSHNWVSRNADVPEKFSDSVRGVQPGFMSLEERDFRLKPDSAFWDFPMSDLVYEDGEGDTHKLTVDREYLQKVWRGPEITLTTVSDFEVHR